MMCRAPCKVEMRPLWSKFVKNFTTEIAARRTKRGGGLLRVLGPEAGPAAASLKVHEGTCMKVQRQILRRPEKTTKEEGWGQACTEGPHSLQAAEETHVG